MVIQALLEPTGFEVIQVRFYHHYWFLLRMFNLRGTSEVIWLRVCLLTLASVDAGSSCVGEGGEEMVAFDVGLTLVPG
jgi:hypothetical protein